MADQSIGNVSLILSLSTSGFVRGLNAVKGTIKSAASGWQSTMMSVATPVAGALTTGLQTALIGGIAGIGVAVGGALAGTLQAAFSTIPDIAKTDQIAKGFGIDSGTFSGIAGVVRSAGADLREFQESMITLGKLGFDAAAGTGQAAEAFRDLGLDAKQFVNLPVDQQLWTVFDALSGVENETQRLRLAAQAFGEDGQKNLIPIIGKSSAELQGMAKALGLTSGEIARATAANAAMNKVWAGLDRLKQKLAVAAAPFIEALANKLTQALPLIDYLSRGFEQFFTIASAVFTEVGNIAGEVWSSITDGGQGFVDWMFGGMPSVEQVVSTAFRFIGEVGANAFDVLKIAAGGLLKVFSLMVQGMSVIVNVFGELLSLANELPDSIKPDWAKGLGDGVKRFSYDMIDFGDRVERFSEGLIADGLNNFGKRAAAVEKWFDRLESKKQQFQRIEPPTFHAPNLKPGEYTPNKALSFGTAEELSARIRAMNGGGQSVADKQLAEAKLGNKTLAQIKDELKAGLGLNRPQLSLKAG